MLVIQILTLLKAPGNNWIETGPHVMIVGAGANFYDLYPNSADPDTSQP